MSVKAATVFWNVALMMEAVSSSETSVNVYHTARCNILEDSHVQEEYCYMEFVLKT
jgi:hypothetical protein